MKGGDRWGFTLVEALVTLSLMALVVQGGWMLFSTFRRSSEELAAAAQGLESIRTVGWILSVEVGPGRGGLDWWHTGTDSLAIRASRGVALALQWTDHGQVVVCYRGIRSPDVEKDSLLILQGDGSWRVGRVTERTPGPAGCVSGFRGGTEVWQVEGGGEGWRLARLFEPRSYHFTAGAFRYRRPGLGRQPLTPGNLERGAFLGPKETGGGVGWRVELTEPGEEAGPLFWTGFIR